MSVCTDKYYYKHKQERAVGFVAGSPLLYLLLKNMIKVLDLL